MDDLLSFSSNACVEGEVWFVFVSVGVIGDEGSWSGSRSGSSSSIVSGRSGLKGPLKILCCANERTGLEKRQYIGMSNVE